MLRAHVGIRFCRGLLPVVLVAWLLPAATSAPGTAAGSSPIAPAPDDYRAPTDPTELLRLDEDIRRFFAARVSRRAPEHARLQQIVDAMLDPEALNFAYGRTGTHDVRETFRRRGGNCVSYAFLLVAVAREFGLDVRFQRVKRETRWDRIGDLVVAMQHVDVRARTDRGHVVVDLEPDILPARDLPLMQVISDRRACAEFYCNAGFERLLRGDEPGALAYTTLATATDPDCSSAWLNLGTLQARRGDSAAAQAAFERALRAEPRNEVALERLATVLRESGSTEDGRRVDRLERRARRIRDHNPYYQLSLAIRDRERGDLGAAEKHLRRAIALKGDEPEFYEQWVAVLEQRGDARHAARAAGMLAQLRGRLGTDPDLATH